MSETKGLRDNLVRAISADLNLQKAIQNWESLSITQQIPYLKQVFKLEVELMKITPPELLFDAKEIPGRAACFDFNLTKPGPGRVILNPEVLSQMPKHASLALLLV